MTQTFNKREDPLNLGGDGGGWASSARFHTWSSYHRRRSGAPPYKRRYHYGSNAAYEPPRKQPKQQHGQGPWFQTPRRPYWAMPSNRWCRGGPWYPPREGSWKPRGWMRMSRECGLQPLYLCCCSCWLGPWHPGWARPPRWKKRWGRRGHGLRRHPRRTYPRNPPMDPNTLYGWRAPGMQAPRNTTQFIMNQIYEDMRQQEELERQQKAQRAQQAQEGSPTSLGGSSPGNDAHAGGGEEDSELPEFLFSCVQKPSFGFSSDPEEENQCPVPQLVEEEEKNDDECDQEECDGKEEESKEEDEEAATQHEEEVEETGSSEEEEEEEEMEEEGEMGEEEMGEEEEGLEEDEQREEENNLPLAIPLSFLVETDEDGENFISCSYLSPCQLIPKMPHKAPITDMNC